jgi:hypothetical protein
MPQKLTDEEMNLRIKGEWKGKRYYIKHNSKRRSMTKLKAKKQEFPETLFVIRDPENGFILAWESVNDISEDCIVGIYQLDKVSKHKIEHTLE